MRFSATRSGLFGAGLFAVAGVALFLLGSPARSDEPAVNSAPAANTVSTADEASLGAECAKMFAAARACISPKADVDTRTRINRSLDLLADNMKNVDAAERPEICKATLVSYRQMAGLTCIQ